MRNLLRMTPKGSPAPKPEPPKVITLKERHEAMDKAASALVEALDALDPKDEIDRALASILVQAQKNLRARIANESMVAGKAVAEAAGKVAI